MLSGCVDIEAFLSLPWLQQEVTAKQTGVRVTRRCDILPEEGPFNDIEESSHWDTIGHLFGGIHGPSVAKPGIHDLCNMLTIDVGCYSSFKGLLIWLEPTGDTENQYNIVGREEFICNGLPKVVTFSSTSPDLPLPDPQYLAFHAACACVVKFSGVAEVTDHIWTGEGEC
ncbi:hypothetical protein RSAG8_10612, partial [Rhizoctonia solani AG-8 WAC10335]